MTPTTEKKTARGELDVPSIPGSAMPAVHRNRGPLGDALREIPEWVQAVEALNHLTEIRPERRNFAGLDVEIEAMVDEAVQNRAALDLEAMAAQARAVGDHLAVQQALSAAFERVGRTHVETLDRVARAEAERLYAALSEHWCGIVARARDVIDVLDMDAEQAITEGRADQWQAVKDIYADARRLRAARLDLDRGLGGWGQDPTTPQYAELRWMANPAEVWENWRAWRVDGALVNPRDISDRKPLSPPWPDSYGASSVGEDEAWLTYLAHTPEAEPWVPSAKSYDKAARELQAYAAGLRQPRRRSTAGLARLR